MRDLSRERANQLFEFDWQESALYWLSRQVSDFANDGACRRWNTLFAGKKAGGIHPTNGYVIVTVDSVKYPAHRVIRMMLFGIILGEIDHIDGDRSNNNPENLRDVIRVDNATNRAIRSDNTSGVPGVSWSKRDKLWRVRISVDGQEGTIGHFKSLDDAIEMRKEAEKRHGYHPNHAKPDRQKYPASSQIRMLQKVLQLT